MSLFSRFSPIRFADAPSVSLIFPDEASLWSCGTLLEYAADHISFQSDRFHVTVDGENLILKAMSQNEALIGGSIAGVRYEKLSP